MFDFNCSDYPAKSIEYLLTDTLGERSASHKALTPEANPVSLILEVKAGPMAGRKVVVRPGETLSIGRDSKRSNFAVTDDSFVSGVHVIVKHDSRGFRINDQKSANGTFLNGAKITEALLKNGDEIRTGQTSFSVQIVSDELLPAAQAGKPSPHVSPLAPEKAHPPITPPSISADSPLLTVKEVPPGPTSKPRESRNVPFADQEAKPVSQQASHRPVDLPPKPKGPSGKSVIFSVGAWTFSFVPEGWEVKEEFGLQCASKDRFPSTVTATEEMLPGASTLQLFVESQVSMLRQYLREPTIEAVLPPAISGAEEKAAFEVRYTTKDRETVFLRRVYARRGRLIGTLTFTTLEKELTEIQSAFEAITAGAKFESHEAV